MNTDEAAQFLGKTEEELMDLVEKGKLTAYQIGGMYLRFKLEQLQNFKNGIDYSGAAVNKQPQKMHSQNKQPFLFSDIRDFLYFNDFYILAVLIIIIMLIIILRNIG